MLKRKRQFMNQSAKQDEPWGVEVVLDTETTGLDPKSGHRIIEIGCVKLIDGILNGEVFQTYINPERDVSRDAFRVHGLGYNFLKDHPTFKEIADRFLEFIAGTRLVIHNAPFDMKFLQAELQALDLAPLENDVFDTLAFARKKFPGSPARLDALCDRYEIDNSHRDKHGALLDAELLAQVYVELREGRQPSLTLANKLGDRDQKDKKSYRVSFPKRSFELSKEILEEHKKAVDRLKKPLWRRPGA
jgi:DNA polymerase-3 subunit epsilon